MLESDRSQSKLVCSKVATNVWKNMELRGEDVMETNIMFCEYATNYLSSYSVFGN